MGVVALLVSISVVAPSLAVPAVGSLACQSISGPTTITDSGCYTLTGDVENSSSSPYVEIQSSDVILRGAGYTLDGQGSGEAVTVDGAYTNVTIENLAVTDWDRAVYVRDVDGLTVDGVTANSNQVGLELDTVASATVADVTTGANTDYGVDVKSSPGIVLERLDVDGSGKTGVRVDGSTDAVLRDVTATKSGDQGVSVTNSGGALLEGVTVDGSTKSGILVDGSVGATVRDATVTNPGEHGLYVTGSGDVVVEQTTAEGAPASFDGVFVEQSDGATLTDVTARNNGRHGVHLSDSLGNASITGAVSTGNGYGFRVHHSDGSLLTTSEARNNANAGLWVSSEWTNVTDSTFADNGEGVYLEKHVHTLADNTISSNGDGIRMDADGNTLVRNDVRSNTNAGFHYVSGQENLVYDNVFENAVNTQADTDVDASNQWHVSPRSGPNVVGGPSIGGNAWLSPDGSGFSDAWNDSDDDGFLDGTYAIDGDSGNAFDQYPLNTVSALTVSPEGVDFGTTNLRSSSTQSVTVESRAKEDVTLDRTTVTGADASAFSVTTDPTPTTLAPGGTATVEMTFAPDTVGTKTATLTVESDTAGVEPVAVSLSGEGTDETAPTAEAGPDRTAQTGDSVTFDGTQSTDNGDIASYEWSFGDGDSATGATPSHSYSSAGTYTVTLMVTDASGNSDSDTATVTVKAPPTATPTPTPTSGSSDGTDSSTGGSGSSGGESTATSTATPTPEPTPTPSPSSATPSTPTPTPSPTASTPTPSTPSPTASTPTPSPSSATPSTPTPTPSPTASTSTTTPTPTATPGPERTVTASSVPADEGERAGATADGVAAGTRLGVSFEDARPSAASVGFTGLSFVAERSRDVALNVTTSADPLSGSPTFERTDNTSKLAHFRVEHSIANENVSSVTVQFTVSQARLASTGADAEDVALYRYRNGSWNELPTTILAETDDGYVFEAVSPGLSEFAAGAKQPQFVLRQAQVDVDKLQVGGDLRVRVRITNTGGADGVFTARLLLNESMVESRELTIAANGTRQLLFRESVGDPGQYEVFVNEFRAGSVVVEGDERPAETSGGGPMVAFTSDEMALAGVGVVGGSLLIGGIVLRRRSED